MSSTTRRRPIGRIVLSVGLFLAGLAAVTITSSMNVKFMSGLSDTDAGHWLQGASALVVDISVALFALAVGVAVYQKRWVAGFLSLTLACLFGAFSFANVVGFGLSERVGKAETVAAEARARAEAVEKTNAARLAAKGETVAWLKKTVTETPSRSERRKLVNEVRAASEKEMVYEPVPVVPASTDRQAEFLARQFGLNPDTVQLWLVTWLAMLLVIGKIAGMSLSAALWPHLEEGADQSGSPEPKEVDPDEDVDPASAANDPGPQAPLIDIRDYQQAIVDRQREDVRRFFAEATVKSAKSRVRADTVYNWYREWNPTSPMSQTQFGRLSGEVDGIVKQPGRYVTYVGIAKCTKAKLKVV